MCGNFFLLNLYQTYIVMYLEMRWGWENVIINETVFQEVTAFGLP